MMTTIAAEPISVPWDTSTGNRFAHYSPEDHSAPLWIAAALNMTYVLGLLFVRVFFKWRVFGWDDVLIILSTVSGTVCLEKCMLTLKVISSVQSMLIFKALNAGLGRTPARVTDIALAGKVSKGLTLGTCTDIDSSLSFRAASCSSCHFILQNFRFSSCSDEYLFGSKR
jgi:hypothetical protein